jgi:plastocyanin
VRRSFPRLLLPVLAVVLVACGSGSHSASVSCVEAVDGLLTITAENLEFDTACIVLPADEPITIRLVNADAQPHNLSIYTDSSKGTPLFQGEIIEGGETIDYEVDPLEAGTNYFDCTVHPEMSGSVRVE